MLYRPVGGVILYLRLEEFARSLPPEAVEALNSGTPIFGFQPLPDGRWLPVEPPPGLPKNIDTVVKQTLTLWITPQNMSIKRNPYREADEAEFSVCFHEVPLDPRIIRSLGFACYLGTIDDTTWAEAIRQGVSPSTVVSRGAKTTTKSLLGAQDLRFIGFADEVTVDMSDSEEVLRVRGRDITGILLDLPVPTKVHKELNWDGPVERVIWDILQSSGACAGIPLHLVGFEPGTKVMKHNIQHKAGKRKINALRPKKINEENYWDLLQAIALENGLILYFDVWQSPDESKFTGRFVLATPQDLYSDKPRTYYDYKTGASGVEPDFRSRQRKRPGSGEILNAPVLIYGHNLASLNIIRRFGYIQRPSVEVRYKAPNGKVWSAKYPEKVVPTRVSVDGLWAADQIRIYTIQAGVEKPEDLKVIAQSIFEQLARQEIEISCETKDLTSFGGDNADPDLLEVKAGTPIEIVIAPYDKSTTIGLLPIIAGFDESKMRDYLISRGVKDSVANILAYVLRSPEWQALMERRFYTKSATIKLDKENGVSLSFEASNYILSRIIRDTK
jgi:hypothetical protein